MWDGIMGWNSVVGLIQKIKEYGMVGLIKKSWHHGFDYVFLVIGWDNDGGGWVLGSIWLGYDFKFNLI